MRKSGSGDSRERNGESEEGTKRVMSGWSPRKRDCILDGVETEEWKEDMITESTAGFNISSVTSVKTREAVPDCDHGNRTRLTVV